MTIYGIPIQIWDALAFTIKAMSIGLTFGLTVVTVLYFILKEDLIKTKKGE